MVFEVRILELLGQSTERAEPRSQLLPKVVQLPCHLFANIGLPLLAIADSRQLYAFSEERLKQGRKDTFGLSFELPRGALDHLVKNQYLPEPVLLRVTANLLNLIESQPPDDITESEDLGMQSARRAGLPLLQEPAQPLGPFEVFPPQET
jgi:hypothetical protein